MKISRVILAFGSLSFARPNEPHGRRGRSITTHTQEEEKREWTKHEFDTRESKEEDEDFIEGEYS
jgi:hypothetical protein